MKISTLFPIEHPEFQNPECIAPLAQALERAGFDNTSVTDHPCPTARWLDAGGHYAQDPFVILSLIAAVTRKLRLQTGILVLPYRNPFITARSVATLDVFSGGRVILGMGAGYLKGEFRALGVDFEKRNELMDEYLRAMKTAWSGEGEFTFKGSWYEATGNRLRPQPIQKPHPPLWVGGNSKRAIRRAVELGDAWYPFFTAGPLSKTTRTADMGDLELREGIAYMREYSEKFGRVRPPEICTGSIQLLGKEWSMSGALDKLCELRELGVSGAAVPVRGKSVAEWCDNAARYGAEVIGKL